MTQLYLSFFAIGLLIFAGIVGYSWLQQSHVRTKREQGVKKKKYDDPIFSDDNSARLEQSDEEIAQSKASVEPKLDAPITDAKNQIRNADVGSRSLTEGSRGLAEGSRSPAEGSRSLAEGSRGLAEGSRGLAEGSRGLAEGSRSPANTDIQIPSKKQGSNKTSLPVVEMRDEPSSTQKEANDVSDSYADTADNVEIINTQPKRDKNSSSIVTELVARVNNAESIEQKELLAVFRNYDFKFHRQVHIYGLNELTDLWRDIEFELPSARFVELGVAIQLADRDGAMAEKELHDFQQMALEFSNHFDAPFEFSMDIDEALVQAKVLDQMGRQYDSMAVLNVVPRSKAGFRVADIESCARDLGMSRSKNGIFLKTTGQKKQISILYRLACTNSSGDFGLSSSNTDAIHDLVMYMNVPATQTPEIVFQDMVKDTNSLATWLEGKVVDKDGAVMTQRSYSVLTQQISDIAFSMQQDGLIPGDAVCKKLF
ncbi:MAG: hypothetical protein KTR16_09260 [Acidiferrobacterales bacterium]|nr:hypothetical protein [Acidiferrobacterales bacterium]